MDGERVDATFELTDKCFVDHAVALKPALPAERLGHNIYPEMSFPAFSMPGMPGVLVGFVDYLQVRRGESLRQLLGDDIACCHASRHSGSRTVRSIGRERANAHVSRLEDGFATRAY